MTHTPSSAPAGAKRFAINPSPTPYAPLNTVLRHFVERVQELLANNFIGAYLQGSFALGDFDENSDADFLIVVERDIADADVPALNALHGAIHDFPEPWGHRLEGSYAPAAILLRWSESPRDPPGAPRAPTWADPGTSGSPPRVYPFLYLDHGARTLVRSEHDNTQVARWITREKGIVLFGPDPRALIDEVSADALRSEMRDTMHRIAVKGFPDPAAIDTRWLQAFLVVLYCRMLHTLQTGTVVSKKAAAQWALTTLDPRWQPLIATSTRFEAEAFSPQPADPHAVAEALAFMRYALQSAASLRDEKGRP